MVGDYDEVGGGRIKDHEGRRKLNGSGGKGRW